VCVHWLRPIQTEQSFFPGSQATRFKVALQNPIFESLLFGRPARIICVFFLAQGGNDAKNCRLMALNGSGREP
jgi:hypothetical protein